MCGRDGSDTLVGPSDGWWSKRSDDGVICKRAGVKSKIGEHSPITIDDPQFK